jgi:type I restriction-modification system DNA methylase subunit
VVRVLIEMLPTYKGRVYEPCCGPDGMFVQSEKFIENRASLLFAYT